MTNRWRQTKIKSFRISVALEERIKDECAKRRINFSKFMRYIAIAAIPREDVA